MRRFDAARVIAGVLALLALLVIFFSACVVDILDPTVEILSPREGGVVAGQVSVCYVVLDNRGVSRVELYVDGELKDTISNPQSDTLVYSLDLLAEGKDTFRTVRIEATDAAENRGQAQVTFFGYGRVPPVPVMVSPTPWDTVASNHVLFTWTAATSAAMYYIQVGRDSGFRSVVIDDSTTGVEYPARAGDMTEPIDRLEVRAEGREPEVRPFLRALRGPMSGSGQVVDSGGLDNGVLYWRLRVRTNYGLASEWSTGRGLVVAARPASIRLGWPPSDTVVTTARPRFTWEHDRNAHRYLIELADNPAVSDPFVSSLVSDTSFVPDSPLADRRLYWRVTGENWLARRGEPSVVWSLVVASGPPSAPELRYPLANSTIAESLPILAWSGRPGADAYCVQVSLDPGFVTWAESATVSDTSLRVAGPLADTAWYWRVRAHNSLGWGQYQPLPGRFTVVARPPQAPVLLAPANRSRTAAVRPEFRWHSSRYADRYHVEVADNPEFRSPVVSDSLADTVYVPGTVLTEGTWYWHVRAGNALGWGRFADSAWSFTVVTQGPPAPRLLYPDSGATVTTRRPTFAWTDERDLRLVQSAGSDFRTRWRRTSPSSAWAGYWLETATDAGFGNVVVSDSSLRDTTYTPTDTLPDGLLFWRVRARDELGLWGPAQLSPWPFTVLARVPAPPNLLAPMPGDTLTLNPVMAFWNQVPTALSYHVQMDDDPGFGLPFVDDSTVTDTSFARELPDYSVTWWRVRASNPAGWGAWSGVRWFAVVTRVPDPLNQVFPPDDTLVNQGYVRFVWQSTRWARRYWLELAYDSGFAQVLHRDSSIADTSSEFGPLPDTTLYWRVCGQNFRGWGQWQASPRRLRVLARLPAAPELLAPTQNDTLTDNPVRMLWSSRASANRYHVQLADNPGFNAPFVDDSTLTDTTYLDSLPDYSTTWWRVRCRNAAGWGQWQASPGWFCVVTVVPGLVEPVYPGPDTTLTTNEVTFAWRGLPWVRAYALEVAFDSLFQSVFFADTSLRDTVCLVSSLPDSLFWWRVRARNPKGWGTWPAAARRVSIVSSTPRPPVLVLPLQGDTLTANPAVVVWQPTGPVLRYHVQLADNPGFVSPFVNDTAVVDTTYADSLPDYSVTWCRVRGRNVAGWGAWTSPARWFGVVTQVPGVVTQVYPPHDTTVTVSQVPFVWRSATWSRKYWLEVAFDTGFSRVFLRDSGLADTLRQVLGLADSTYYWRVRAQNKKGWGPWQPVARRLTVITQTPPVPDLVLPVFGDTLTANPVRMVWTRSATAFRYRIQLADNPGFSPVLADDSMRTDTSFLYSLPDYSRTFWRVRARNVAGWSQWTAPAYWFCVTTLTPGELAQVYPSPDATVLASQTQLLWQSGFWANKYALELAHDADFTSLVLQDTTLTDTSRGSGTLADTTYYWRVRARNKNGWGVWQAVPRRFSILTQPPPAPVPIGPAQGDTLTTNPVRMSWAVLRGVQRYRIQLAEDPDFTALLADDSTLTDTGFSYSLPDYSIAYWRVCARNLFAWGPWSSPARWFGVVSQVPGQLGRVSPPHDTTVTANQVLFVWFPAQWARRYALELAYDAGFNHIFLRDTNVTTTQRLVTSLSDTVYYWRVRAQNKKGWGSWQVEAWALRVLTALPPAPTPFLPVSGDTLIANPVHMHWRGLSGVLRFHVQLDDDPGFGSPFVNDTLVTDTTFSSNLPDYSRTFWRVRARNLAGWGNWSASPRWFCVVTSAPGQVSRISPASDTTLATQSPTFVWHSLFWVRKYWFQLAYDSLFTAFYVDDSGVADTARFVSGLADTTYYWRVCAQNRKGWGSWQGAGWRVHIQTLVPPIPLLLAPANGDTLTEVPVLMHWRNSATATRYRIQLADNPSFVLPFVDDSTATDTLFSRSLPDYSYTWWRVAARNAAGWSNWSSARSFGVVTVVPPELFRVWPPDDTTLVSAQTTLHWNGADWIRAYHVQAGPDSLFGSLVLNDSLVTDTFRLTGSLPDTTYFWRVRARNKKGWGSWQTALARFTVLTQPPAPPTLALPLLGDTLTDNPVRTAWLSQRAVLRYRIQLADNPSFISPLVDDSTVTDTSFLRSLPDYSVTYWRVRARNAAGWSGWSSTRWFGVVTTLPGPGEPVYPPDDTTITSSSTELVWRSITWPRKYWLELSYDSMFASAVFRDSALSDTSRVSGALLDTTCYWRVRAQNKKGWGGWPANLRRFHVQTQVPQAPGLVLPAQADTLTGNPVQMSWSRSATAFRYRVQLADNPGFSPMLIDDSTLTDTGFQYSLLDYSVTYWRVAARNLVGWSNWSTVRYYAVVTTVPPVLTRLVPPDDTTVTDDSIRFHWHSTIWARKYWFELAVDSLFTDVYVSDSMVDDTTRRVLDLPDTTYYWRVRAQNKKGWGSWQAGAWSVRVLTQVPSPPLLLLPETGDTVTTNPVLHVWHAGQEILRYQVQLDDDPDFSSSLADDSTLTDTTYFRSLPDYSRTYWRARARNLAGWSNWSASPRWYCVLTALPDTVSRLFPPADTTVTATTIDLVWQPQPWCQRHWVQLARDSSFTDLFLDDSTVLDSVRPVVELADTTYYWRVRARNKVGWSQWHQAIWSFTVMSHPEPARSALFPPRSPALPQGREQE